MKAESKKKKTSIKENAKEKERIFKALTQVFASQGFKVRREELKRGSGWKASSGSCRKMDEKLIFVDRRASIDEQIAFLVQAFLQSGLSIDDQSISDISESLRSSVLLTLGGQPKSLIA